MHKCIGHNENGSKKQVHSNKWMQKNQSDLILVTQKYT